MSRSTCWLSIISTLSPTTLTPPLRLPSSTNVLAMEPDRKSMVSSFYGGRKSSMDALNSDFPSQHPGAARTARDDASSFYNPDPRGSIDALGTRSASLGYNSSSFYPGREEPLKGGRDEEEDAGAWDVYADFNNAGPRYSTAFVSNTNTTSTRGYQPLEPSTPSKVEADNLGAASVEMVTVPALGAEWAKAELRDMTKAGKREKKTETRRDKWKQWNRGERGMCGSYCTRKFFVWFMFGLAAAIALVLGFCLPRVPSFSFNSRTPLVNATGDWLRAVPFHFSRAPANFSFPAFASLQVDTDNNYVPIKFNHMRASVFDLDTGRQVGKGDILRSRTLPPKKFSQIFLPLNITYVATNDTDQTWVNWYNGCKNKLLYINGVRPPVKFRLVLDLDILGLPSRRIVSTQVADAGCPIELPTTI